MDEGSIWLAIVKTHLTQYYTSCEVENYRQLQPLIAVTRCVLLLSKQHPGIHRQFILI